MILDKIGEQIVPPKPLKPKATLMMIGVNILGIILLMIGKSMVLLIIGAFMFGSCYSLGAVAVPLLTKYFFKTENYAKAFPSFQQIITWHML